MTRTGFLWLAATGCAVTLAAAGPQAGSQSAQTPAAKPAAPATGSVKADPRVAKLKEQVLADVSSPAMFDLGQVMTDQVFSYGELGFQEFETQKYLTGILERTTASPSRTALPASPPRGWPSGARASR